MIGRRVVTAATFATIALVFAGALAGSLRGVALYAYVLVLGALGLLTLSRGLRSGLPRTPDLDQLTRRPPAADERVPQLEAVVRRISAGRSSAFDLHYRLRPMVREIASAQLARRHGLDLDRRPEQARALLGERVWELVRPDRESPEQRLSRGWSTKQLAELIDELEAI